jgi:Leucine-rich repeat (LRR) protein
MQKIYTLLTILLTVVTQAQIVNIPNANFKAKLLQASSGNTIASSQTPFYDTGTSTWVVASYNVIDTNGDGEIQVLEAQSIKWLKIYDSSISDLSGIEAFTNLQYLDCTSNQLTSLNVSSLTSLQAIYCYFNQLPSLNVSGLINLKYLHCSNNLLPILDVSGLTNLQFLHCSSNQLPSLNVSGLTSLQVLTCFTNQLPSLNVSSLTNLQDLECQDNLLPSLDVSGLTNLKRLNCSGNQLPSLNVSGLTNLQDLNCSGNQLPSLDVSSLTNLQYLHCHFNQLPSLNVSGLTNLIFLACSNNLLPSLNVSGLTNLGTLYCHDNQLTSLNVSGLTNLESLYCNDNQISSLNVSGLANLRYLDCFNNLLPSLNVSGLANLQMLHCNNNQLTSLDVSGLTSLQILQCNNNQLPSLNVSVMTNLQTLDCSYNQLPNLNVSGLTNLQYLYCSSNLLPSLDVSGLTNLQQLYCSENQLPNLNVSGLTNLQYLHCASNLLTSLFIKNNNSNWESLDFSENLNLQYICADEEDLSFVQSKINENNIGASCHVNSYCSFTPGGTFYAINGLNRLDSNNNGCDSSDGAFPNLKLNITNGTQTGSFIANEAGNYIVPVQAGTHTLTPVFENPSYFNISPTTVTVDFPTEASPFTQNFCITPNGEHHDIEVTVIPIDVARPGFDASYKIIYKNKGNQIENASLNFDYNDNVMDFLNASVATTSQNSGLLAWNLGALLPLQSGTITVSFNMNTPMETPPLNGGDILAYTATIATIATDESPTDNVFTLNQTVVNSYDPNDKICLEGSMIDPSKIGGYLHYQIRFENTGTYPAQNIVVKDMIDTTKFDITSLQITNSSHTCYTKITGDKVEFIFENINLPFDDATNDGYVVFKIKSLPTLTVNSTVSNSAAIYFDYNFPIITNTATSTYQLLNANSFVFENEFALYPNPVNDKFSIKTKNGLEIQSIEIYNTLGQIVLSFPKTSENIDISELQTGTYFVKVSTEKGKSSVTIIKK